MKNLKSGLFGLVASLLVVVPAFANDGITMDGLIESESLTITHDNFRVDHKFDGSKLDKELVEADALIRDIGELYRTILTKAERDEVDFFRTWDEERYMAMKRAGASFQNKMKELQEKLTATSSLFKVARNELLPRDVHISILERAGHFVRNVTIYNTFVDFGVSRRLRFDTMTPFDELQADLLEKGKTALIEFPTMFLPRVQETRASLDANELEGGVVHERSSITVTDTVVHLPLDQSKLTELLAKAEELIKKASDAREHIVGSGAQETTRYGYGRNRTSVEYTCELSVFEDTHKPHIIDYVLAMVELKGYCNELTARLNVSKNFVGDLNIRGDWEKAKTRFAELASWGDAWIVTFDPWNKLERWFKFFPGYDFSKRHIFSEMMVKTPSEVAREIESARKLRQMRTEGMISADEAIDLLYTMDSAYRLGKAKTMAPRIYDLTTNNVIRIGKTFDSYYRDDWVEYVMGLSNFKGNI